MLNIDCFIDKPARKIIKLLFGFASHSVFSVCQAQQKNQQIVRRQLFCVFQLQILK